MSIERGPSQQESQENLPSEIDIYVVEEVTGEVVAALVPLMRDAAAREQARLAMQDPMTVFYKVWSGTDDPVFQWSNPRDPNLSYMIGSEEHTSELQSQR